MLGANVEKEIARRGDGVAPGSADLTERVQFYRSRPAEEPVPGVAPDPHHARQARLLGPKSNGSDE